MGGGRSTTTGDVVDLGLMTPRLTPMEDDGIPIIATTRCPRCGRDVPSANFVLHDVACGQGHHHRGRPIMSGEGESSSGRVKRRSGEADGVESASSSTSSSDSTRTVPSREGGGWGGGRGGRSSPPPESHRGDDQSAPPPLGEGQWQCTRCTLINDGVDVRCDACEARREGGGDGVDENLDDSVTTSTTIGTDPTPPPRPPDPTVVGDRLVGGGTGGEEWVNVTFDPRFRRDTNGIIGPLARGGGNGVSNSVETTTRVNNPLVHGQGAMGTFARVLNGMVNGAIIGTVYAGAIGAVVGATIGGLGGAVTDARRRREEEEGMRDFAPVADDLRLWADGGLSPSNSSSGGIMLPVGGTRTHRSDDGRYFMAVHRDRDGRGDRIIRVRYDVRRPTTTTAVESGAMGGDDHLERTLIDALARMSNLRGFGHVVPGGRNVILQPTESFEELVARFGIGTEGRGASREVIDSYPVEVIARGGGEGSMTDGGNHDDRTDLVPEKDGRSSKEENGNGDETEFGTCAICLEDYRVGEGRKRLSCPNHPHSFHAECIDRWLTVVASCPICKSAVTMYEPGTTS
jgi:hypothetical protein